MNKPLRNADSIDEAILQYLKERDDTPTNAADDPVFDGIDSEQPLGMVEVRDEDTDRFMRMVRDTLDGPDNLGPDDKTLRP